jgi:hypothetical protein
LSTKYGSVDNLKVSVRWDCRPNARQIRATVDCDRPISWAIARVDQCVAFFGVGSSVFVTTAATCSSVTVRGPPGRGMSPSPAIRCSTNRARHRPGRRTPAGAGRWHPRPASSLHLGFRGGGLRPRPAMAGQFLQQTAQMASGDPREQPMRENRPVDHDRHTRIMPPA